MNDPKRDEPEVTSGAPEPGAEPAQADEAPVDASAEPVEPDEVLEAAAEPVEEPEAPDEADEVEVVEVVEEIDEQAALVRSLEARIAELQAEVDGVTAKLRTVSKAYKDLQSDFSAFRTRTKQQEQVLGERRAAEAVQMFFDPVQNLGRSLDAAGDADESLMQGLRMVQGQFKDALTKLGLEEVPGVGTDFDPNLHEALAVTPVADASMDGKVLMVHTTGYRVKGRVIQAAQVLVGKYEAPAEAVPPDDGEDEPEEPAAAGGDEEPTEPDDRGEGATEA